MNLKRIIIAVFNSAVFKKLIELRESIKSKNYERIGFLRSIYYKNAFAECGEDLKIYGKPIIYQPKKIHVGNHLTINNGAQISPRGEVYIGDYVTISRGAQITAGGLDTSTWVEGNYQKREHIQRDVYIGGGMALC